MLKFNPSGYLPEGIHEITLEKFQTIFGFNNKRKDMIREGLIPFLNELAPHKVQRVYLDGSFVTNKENPGDIDGYVMTESHSKLFYFILINYERWKLEYRVDLYAAFTDLTGVSEDCSKEWWESKFSSIPRSEMKKGYVSLKIPAKGGG